MTKDIVFILFNGYGSSKAWWEYDFGNYDTANLKKVNFLSQLKKLGNVYTFNYPFFNINYYTTPKTKKLLSVQHKLDEKYNPYSKNIHYNINDLDYKNICTQVYDNVIKKYGQNKKYVLIGHSYGCHIALLFSKLFKRKVLFNVLIDNPPYNHKLIKEYKKSTDKKKKIVDKFIPTNDHLQKILSKIKNKSPSENINKEIDKVYALNEYYSGISRLKYFDPILPVYTIFFRAYFSDPDANGKKSWNKWAITEKNEVSKNNTNFKYIICLDAHHFVWYVQEYSDNIINEIKYMLQ